MQLLFFEPMYEGMTSDMYIDQISKFILENQLDVLHLPSPMSFPYPEVFNSTRIPPIRTVATVYDVIPMMYPDVYLANESSRNSYDSHLRMLQHPHRLLSVSEWTRQDLIRMGFQPGQIVSVGTGPDEGFYRLPNTTLDAVQHLLPANHPFVLAVSPMDFRKNAERLVEAFARATRDLAQSFQLLLVGPVTSEVANRLSQMAADHGRPGSVHCLGHVSKSQLLRLYNLAHVVALPSLYEGWGFDVLNAMQCGAPVLTSNSTSIPEVSGATVFHVDPLSVESISEGLRVLLTDPLLRSHLAASGLQRADQFRWQEVANKTVAVYRDLMREIPSLPRQAVELRVETKVHLQPNRYGVVRRGKYTRNFVSFNLLELPSDANIKRAVLHVPTGSKAAVVQLRLIKSGWSEKGLRRRAPGVRTPVIRIKRLARRPGKECTWNCTVLARKWRRYSLRNHGVMINGAVRRRPTLAVTFYRTVTTYR
ncbi:glycosyltransferase [Alicyclobacillus mengziensis]|uniref:Glycosyltransferase family 4 protein n=1 Tax=Alicyclobacillus mengziensis TaxID=2931921 RepID=A0A9X7Z4X4_9BACL|nr:glycosyltransferase [Alicyclobacillus mengziensis]QSO46369.1 glycosyltransferase family 4 protein [Alicyclobacillus mengziensis]